MYNIYINFGKTNFSSLLTDALNLLNSNWLNLSDSQHIGEHTIYKHELKCITS